AVVSFYRVLMFFFFSSRRRHTRSKRDWSSDVCSSDLAKAGRRVLLFEREQFPRFHVGESLLPATVPILDRLGALPAVAAHGFQRSEERRVGKECRSRLSPYP